MSKFIRFLCKIYLKSWRLEFWSRKVWCAKMNIEIL
jgi:hypothetical protein